ncbi:Detected protein of unknown function [Hibiscus syriacus]|uniref:Integrase catalytic domain-containing protein n=1 Tax=Hibiscus syriacus TaxID=106335 RepID=A0A6A2ZNH1_HIBSY|nr:Detected protein of unknown function [Hibiscus syriacus]
MKKKKMPPFFILNTLAMLFSIVMALKVCPHCGRIPVPYPLSTGPDCGDPWYKVRCNEGTLWLDAFNGSSYNISSVNPMTQTLIIDPPGLAKDTCMSADFVTQGLQLGENLPFNITSTNTVMIMNCSATVLQEYIALNCSSTSVCHEYTRGNPEANANCGALPICRCLPVSEWPKPGMEIQWLPPREPEYREDAYASRGFSGTPFKESVKKRSKRSQIRVGAMAADEGNVKIEKFGGADFGFWKMQIEDFLYQKNLYQSLSGKQPEGMKNEDSKEKTTAGIMTPLSSMYEKPSASNKVHLMRNDQFKRDCRALNKDTGAQESANMTEETGDAIILSVNSPIESWILDSWASFHSTPCKEIIENYVSCDFGKVHLANDETLKIVGKGDIRLKLPNQTTWKLTEITKGELVISRGKKIGTLYVTTNLENIIAVADADGKSNLWHQRLGHMSEKGMKTLLSKGKLKWKVMVENEIGLKVKRLRSDNGGEYINNRFRDFCTNNGIKMETTVSMTPQQNDVAERMNITLNERARSMRIHARLPKLLWVEAINTAAYLINCGPLVPLDGGIPEEVWSKKEINLSHLRMFGCISYVHIDSAERSKLDVKSNKCVFVGYGGDELGYRFWEYENRKIIRSRDVIFNENVMYKDRSSTESSSSNTDTETNEFAEFEEIYGNDVQISPEEVQKKQAHQN